MLSIIRPKKHELGYEFWVRCVLENQSEHKFKNKNCKHHFYPDSDNFTKFCIFCGIISDEIEFTYPTHDKNGDKITQPYKIEYIVYNGLSYFTSTISEMSGENIPWKHEYLVEQLINFELIKNSNNMIDWIQTVKKLKSIHLYDVVNYIPYVHKIKLPFDIVDLVQIHTHLDKNKPPNSRLPSANYIIWRSFILSGKVDPVLCNWVPLWYSTSTIESHNKKFDPVFHELFDKKKENL